MVLLVIFLNFTPDFSALYTYYMTDFLLFTTEDLANFSTFSSITAVIAMLLYYFYLKKMKPQNLFKISAFLSWVVSFSFLLVVLQLVQKWGLNTKMFCLLTFGFNSLVGELNLMPIIAIWCGICPKNLEGLSITLITGISNISSIFSEYFGALIIWMFKFKKDDYDSVWKAVLIENGYFLFIIIIVFIVDFPEISIKNKNEEESKEELKELVSTN